MPITTVLLDAGGVLLDEAAMEASRGEATAAFLAERVPGYSIGMYWADVEEAVRAFSADAYRHVFRKHLPPDREADAYRAFLERWYPSRPPLRLMDGIDAEVRALAPGFRLGIAGQYGAELLALLDATGLLDCFAWRFTQDDFEHTKPDPRYLEEILQACGVEAAACVMVGDRIDNDVIPAKQLGMRTIRIRGGLHRKQEPRSPAEKPDAELGGVEGLAAAVGRLATS